MFERALAGKGLKGILGVVLVVGLVSAGLGAFTLAYFEDTDTSSSNTVQSGTLNVTIDGTDDGTTNDFSVGPGKPLDSATKNYTIENGGSTAANHLQVNMSFSENDATGTYAEEPGDSDLKNNLTAPSTAKYIEVTKLTYHDGTSSTDLLTSINNGSNGIADLADVQNASALDDLTAPQASKGNKVYLEITVRIASDDHGLTDADENVMGDGVDVKVHFTLMQDSSQDSI